MYDFLWWVCDVSQKKEQLQYQSSQSSRRRKHIDLCQLAVWRALLDWCLCLGFAKILSNMHFNRVNPEIDLESLKLQVPKEPIDCDYWCLCGGCAHCERRCRCTRIVVSMLCPSRYFLYPFPHRSQKAYQALLSWAETRSSPSRFSVSRMPKHQQLITWYVSVPINHEIFWCQILD